MRDEVRRKAAMDIAEALGFSGGEPLPPREPLPTPLQPRPAAPQMPPGPGGQPQPGALTAGMPPQRPAMSPLQNIPSFRSPPMAAALQGAVGREGPVGFARGGFVVRRY